MRKLEDIIASLTESITFEAYNHAANELNELVTIHALNRVLYHLSEDNYRAPSDGREGRAKMWMAQYQGRAAARVIVKHRIRSCQPYDAMLWQQMKDGE